MAEPDFQRFLRGYVIDHSGRNTRYEWYIRGGIPTSIYNQLVARAAVLSIGNWYDQKWFASFPTGSTGPPILPTDPNSQNVLVWRVSCVSDGSGEPIEFLIPSADTQFLLPNSDKIDMSQGAVINFVQRANDTLSDEFNSSVTVQDIYISGE